jgi:hypothetical protein
MYHDIFATAENVQFILFVEGSNGTSVTVTNLGEFKSAPSYNEDTKLISLQYRDGDLCSLSGKRYSVNISFRCKSGQIFL